MRCLLFISSLCNCAQRQVPQETLGPGWGLSDVFLGPGWGRARPGWGGQHGLVKCLALKKIYDEQETLVLTLNIDYTKSLCIQNRPLFSGCLYPQRKATQLGQNVYLINYQVCHRLLRKKGTAYVFLTNRLEAGSTNQDLHRTHEMTCTFHFIIGSQQHDCMLRNHSRVSIQSLASRVRTLEKCKI